MTIKFLEYLSGIETELINQIKEETYKFLEYLSGIETIEQIERRN